MEGGFEAPAKKHLKMGEGSGAEVVDAVGGDGGSGAVARDGGSGSRGVLWSGGAGGSRGGGSDAAVAAASAEIFVPNKKKRKNRKTRMQRGLSSMKLGLRPPALDEFVDDKSKEEPDDEVDDDKESRDKKSRHVLNQLRQGRWDFQPAVGKYNCPFCKTVKTTDYDWMVAHAIGIGLDDNGHAAHIRAKHAAYGVFLQRMKVD